MKLNYENRSDCRNEIYKNKIGKIDLTGHAAANNAHAAMTGVKISCFYLTAKALLGENVLLNKISTLEKNVSVKEF